VQAEFAAKVHPVDEIVHLAGDQLAEGGSLVHGVVQIELFFELENEGAPAIAGESPAAVGIEGGEGRGDGALVDEPEGKTIQAVAEHLHQVIDEGGVAVVRAVEEAEPGVNAAAAAGGVQAVEEQEGKRVEQQVPAIMALVRESALDGAPRQAELLVALVAETALNAPFRWSPPRRR